MKSIRSFQLPTVQPTSAVVQGVLVSRSEINFEEQADQDKIRVQGYLEGQSRVDLMQKKPATKQVLSQC